MKVKLESLHVHTHTIDYRFKTWPKMDGLHNTTYGIAFYCRLHPKSKLRKTKEMRKCMKSSSNLELSCSLWAWRSTSLCFSISLVFSNEGREERQRRRRWRRGRGKYNVKSGEVKSKRGEKEWEEIGKKDWKRRYEYVMWVSHYHFYNYDSSSDKVVRF